MSQATPTASAGIAGGTPTATATQLQATVRTPGVFGSLVETTKPRITRLVTITSGVGFLMASIGAVGSVWSLIVPALGCILGTALSSSGANALNQLMERRRDALMPRTRSRPLPRGSLTAEQVLVWGSALCVAGVAVLWATTGPAPAAISAATILIYLLLYTPLKPVTPLATIVGAVPGALPPLIGWTAAAAALSTAPGAGFSALLEPGGWSLFLIMFVWQIPHVLALSWLYKDDYAAGGYMVLPMVDPEGRQTSFTILVWTLLLLPVSLAPAWMIPSLGAGYIAAATLTTLVFLYFAARCARTLTRADCRAAFIGSVIHLPVLLAAMVVDAAASAIW